MARLTWAVWFIHSQFENIDESIGALKLSNQQYYDGCGKSYMDWCGIDETTAHNILSFDKEDNVFVKLMSQKCAFCSDNQRYRRSVLKKIGKMGHRIR